MVVDLIAPAEQFVPSTLRWICPSKVGTGFGGEPFLETPLVTSSALLHRRDKYLCTKSYPVMKVPIDSPMPQQQGNVFTVCASHIGRRLRRRQRVISWHVRLSIAGWHGGFTGGGERRASINVVASLRHIPPPYSISEIS